MTSSETIDGRSWNARYQTGIGHYRREKSATGLVFFVCALGLIVRNLLNSNVINEFYPYSISGGSIILKIHPGSYLFILAAVLAMSQIIRTGMREWSLPIFGSLQLLVVIVLVLVLGLFTGHSANISYLIDSMAIAPLAILTLTTFSLDQMMRYLRLGMMVIFANALFVMLQFTLRDHILPYPTFLTNGIFRPGGIVGHPLIAGLLTVSCIPLLPLARFRPGLHFVMISVWSLAVVMTSARVATAALPVILALTYLNVAVKSRMRPAELVMLLLFAVLVGAMIVLAAYSAGLLDRVLGGFFDDSSQARVDVYGILSLLTPSEFLYGADLDTAQYYLLEFFSLEYIESPVVLYIINFGLIGALLFGASLLFFFVSLAVAAPNMVRLSTLAFLAVALTNNTLAVKGPTPVLVSSMLYIAGVIERRQRDSAARQRKAQLAARYMPVPPGMVHYTSEDQRQIR
jgi:hypothetical protein